MARQAQTLYRKPQYANNQVASLPVDTTLVTGADAAHSLYEGDLVKLSTGLGVAPIIGGAISAALVADLGLFLGLSGTTDPSPYWNNKRVDSALVNLECVAALYQTAADVYHLGDEVMVGADSQTITKCPVGPSAAAAGLFTAGTVTGGTLTAATHVVTMSYLTAIGETQVGTPSAAITATAGQGLIYDYDAATAVVIPAWAIGFCIYIDGIFALTVYAAPVADLSITGTNPNTVRVAPDRSALSIGRIVSTEAVPIGQNYQTGITGVSGKFIGVRLKNKYPFNAPGDRN